MKTKNTKRSVSAKPSANAGAKANHRQSAPKLTVVDRAPAPGPVTAGQSQKKCRAFEIGHRSCKCGREGCGNGS
jgi:hypothetical protein